MIQLISIDKNISDLMPLVFHKIVKASPSSWEDVSYRIFTQVINFISDKSNSAQNVGNFDELRWLLTFDDGNASDYEIVFPDLIDKGISSIFFIITDNIGAPGYLSWSQIREMSRYGMEFGSHSCSHPMFSKLSTSELVREFRKSRAVLAEGLGNNVDSFSYPYGVCAPKMHDLALQEGYKYIFTSNHGIVSTPAQVFPRNCINSRMNERDVLRLLQLKGLTSTCWYIESLFKKTLKLTLGEDRYRKIRDTIFDA